MHPFPPTLMDISSWGGPSLLKEAEGLLKRGEVRNVRFDGKTATGEVKWGTNFVKAGFVLSFDLRGNCNPRLIDNICRCAVNQRDGGVCVHAVALGMQLFFEEHDEDLRKRREQEERHARILAEAEKTQGGVIRRAPVSQGGQPAEIRIRLPQDWGARFWDDRAAIEVACRVSIAGAPSIPVEKACGTPLALSRENENLLAVLEDICEGHPKNRITLSRADFVSLLELHRANRLKVYLSGSSVPLAPSDTKVRVPVSVDLIKEETDEHFGELYLFSHPIPPGETETDPFATMVAFGNTGWVQSGTCLYRMETVVPEKYQKVYARAQCIPRKDLVRFLSTDLKAFRDRSLSSEEISVDLFEMVPAEPTFSLLVKGSLASLKASLHALYADGEYNLVVGADESNGAFALPDPDNIFRYRVRNKEAEAKALNRLVAMGFNGPNGGTLEPVVGEREVLNILGGGIPAVERLGWKVRLLGNVQKDFAALPVARPVAQINAYGTGPDGKGGGMEWFDVGFEARIGDSGARLSYEEVRQAIQYGESFVRRGDSVILFDSATARSVRDLSAKGKMRSSEAAFVQKELEELGLGDSRSVEAVPEWKKVADRLNRRGALPQVDVGERLGAILRPYQKDGVSWLRSMEETRTGGILADEMGLGKTLQTLTWLQLERVDERMRGLPALIVCPTSLVANWCHEALTFTPELAPLKMSGAARHENWERIPKERLVVTSYALLRRDIERYAKIRFSCVVLDEAQNIKNRTTQNAVAVKMLQTGHRLVLTGTPVENGVSDLWSIMDFLMPGHLDTYLNFKAEYELPMSMPGEPEAEAARRKLQAKMHAFLFRRHKRDVAKDLPEKIVQVSYSELSEDQKVVYKVLLERTKSSVSGMVASEGFGASRMKILAELMRLRQACCHLALLKSAEEVARLAEKAASPSAKTEQFFELLDEARGGGHKMLVFSQFTSMLKILRARLDEEGVPYCYLDGESKDRLESCQRFNSRPEIPVFLISLKAGGTGLNLTGADMVVHFDPWWNPAAEDQATDRAHRIGQKKTVSCLKLIAQGTIEEKVLELQRKKRALIDAAVEGSAAASLDEVTWDEVRDILGIQ